MVPGALIETNFIYVVWYTYKFTVSGGIAVENRVVLGVVYVCVYVVVVLSWLRCDPAESP